MDLEEALDAIEAGASPLEFPPAWRTAQAARADWGGRARMLAAGLATAEDFARPWAEHRLDEVTLDEAHSLVRRKLLAIDELTNEWRRRVAATASIEQVLRGDRDLLRRDDFDAKAIKTMAARATPQQLGDLIDLGLLSVDDVARRRFRTSEMSIADALALAQRRLVEPSAFDLGWRLAHVKKASREQALALVTYGLATPDDFRQRWREALTLGRVPR